MAPVGKTAVAHMCGEVSQRIGEVCLVLSGVDGAAGGEPVRHNAYSAAPDPDSHPAGTHHAHQRSALAWLSSRRREAFIVSRTEMART
jgi:hypothetical protein